MKATKSKDGLTRLTVKIETRVGLWDLLVCACSDTEKSDKRLTTISQILQVHKDLVLEFGLYWDTDNWGDYLVKVCDEHFDYYIELLSKYFNETDIAHARKMLESYR
jgi:hypothetical protein